ncbi:hypothetical protein OJAV_G00125860 [Oryzias javanicus]|uniref:Uncharacterized protein n=1 Tax=Oryzias javanicus TaxID=123683 RepID=A0A437CPN8_ORYJA|nr:hypothetical protein OJAV_G00125860 [Oryzias javanicus]
MLGLNQSQGNVMKGGPTRVSVLLGTPKTNKSNAPPVRLRPAESGSPSRGGSWCCSAQIRRLCLSLSAGVRSPPRRVGSSPAAGDDRWVSMQLPLIGIAPFARL